MAGRSRMSETELPTPETWQTCNLSYACAFEDYYGNSYKSARFPVLWRS